MTHGEAWVVLLGSWLQVNVHIDLLIRCALAAPKFVWKFRLYNKKQKEHVLQHCQRVLKLPFLEKHVIRFTLTTYSAKRKLLQQSEKRNRNTSCTIINEFLVTSC